MQVEKRSIDFIPETERHGRPGSLFFIWFGANMNITTIASGVLPVVMGLNLFWSALAIIIGSLVGAIFMASHSAQGPKLGIPQMIQSRAQFGVLGAVLPLLFVMLIYLGFFVSNTLLAAQALESVSPLPANGNIYLIGALCFVVALYGYRLIHRLQKLLSILSLLVFAAATLFALQYSYAGTVTGGAWMMILGAILSVGIGDFSSNVGGHVAGLFGSGAILLFAFIVYGQVSINVFNLYGAFMSTITVIEPFARLKVTPRVRGLFMLVISLVATALCTISQDNFIAFFLNFIFFMSYFLIPWTAINLVDYYCLRKGQYRIDDIFDLQGIYGRINWIACGSFMLAIALEVPFMNTTLYVGPIATALDGVDLAWLVGLLVPALSYYWLMKRYQRAPMLNEASQ
jgi:NCS1 family nucleobase:cation symporter-1